MRKLIAILTGLHVLAHGVFGCCDHGWAAMAAPKVEASSSCACHHAHHDQHDSQTAPAADICDAVGQNSPAPAPHECVHASCHWIAGGGGPGIASLEAYGAVLFDAVVPTETSLLLAGHYRPGDDSRDFLRHRCASISRSA